MSTPTISDLLKYANLQMAAEAFLVRANGTVRDDIVAALIAGNARGTVFSSVAAQAFSDQWEVVDQEANTSTGFSGTLFRNKANPSELVISFRSTEFIDDAARDNEATNKLEIADAGFAFGQIADMEAWYARLKASNHLPAGATFSVTGYSLGGHLATVFNQLHQNEMNGGQVVTFNGAGIGRIGSGTLTEMLATFQDFLAKGREGGPGLAELFQSQPGRDAYAALRAAIAANGGIPTAAMRDIVANTATINYQDDPAWLADKELLLGANGALTRALQVQKLANDVTQLKSGNDKPGPAAVAHDKIGAENIDYQLAVLATRQKHQTEARSIAGDASAMLLTGGIAKEYGEIRPANQYDIVGWEYSNNRPSAVVAHSLWHYGQDMKVFIEDQPLWRGGIFGSALSASLASAGVRLLVDGFSQRDFGDTHSLVLLVDSLNIQNTLLQLAPGATQETLNGILKAASNLKRENGDLLGGAGQGKSEGDALENVVNALGRLFVGPEAWEALYGDPEGNTWARMEDASRGNGEEVVVYSGRNTFYKNLDLLTKLFNPENGPLKALTGKLALGPVNLAEAKEKAKTDFAAFATLYALTPFTLGLQAGATGTLEDSIKGAWGKVYQDWQEDKALSDEDRSAGKAIYSDQWYADRSAFLGYWLQSTGQNVQIVQDGNAGLNTTDQRIYKQLDDGRKIIVRNSANGETGNDKESQYILFGGNKLDLMAGGKLEDRFYGGGGLDYLDGKTGNDTLDGGAGLDFYRFMKGDGADKLADYREEIDGKRRARALLQRNNELLVLAYKDGDVWKGGTGDKAFTATKSGNDLILTFADAPEDRLTLKDFDFEDAKTGRGSHGLRLIDPLPAAANPVRTFLGDTEDWDSDPAQTGIQWVQDAFGNRIRADGQDGRPLLVQTNRNDILYGSPGNESERFETGEGADVVYADGPESLYAASGGIDLIETGKGRDAVFAGGGNDHVQGGEDGDILYGNGGDDILYADAAQQAPSGGGSNSGASTLEAALKAGETAASEAGQGDLLTGDGGNDTLIGSARNDALLGGSGSDILVGGGGDDNLIGDGSANASFDWQAARGTELQPNGSPRYHLNFTGMDESGRDGVTGDADLLIGGAGNDWAFAGGGDDLLQGGSGADVLFGDAGSDVLQGGEGNDFLAGDNAGAVPAALEGNDILDGGAGNDILDGHGGNDILIGGTGDDIMAGGAGRDIYLYNKGDGTDTLWDTADTAADPEASILILNGVKKADVKFRKGSLFVDVGDVISGTGVSDRVRETATILDRVSSVTNDNEWRQSA